MFSFFLFANSAKPDFGLFFSSNFKRKECKTEPCGFVFAVSESNHFGSVSQLPPAHELFQFNRHSGFFWGTYVDLQPSSIWLLDFIRTVDFVTFIPKIDC